VDLGERYYQLSRLGRDTFCASVAQATLVRSRANHEAHGALALGTGSGIAEIETDRKGLPSMVKPSLAQPSLAQPSLAQPSPAQPSPLLAGASFTSQMPAPQEIIPLVKKLGTPFVDLITLGRTEGNDIMVEDISVSRFQAFFRRRYGRWFVCDAGSSNGTRVNGTRLQPRTEAEVLSHTKLHFGAVEYRFHTADSLYDVLVNWHTPERSSEGNSSDIPGDS
jgi:hypothetical protein